MMPSMHKLVIYLFFMNRIRSFRQHDAGNSEASSSGDTPNGRYSDELLGNCKTEMSSPESSFLAKLAIALGIAATVTVISVGFKWPPNLGSSLGVPSLVDSSSASVSAAPSVGFSFKVFGYSVVLPEYAPGWIYFWLLMAAGCGLFVSEEALNIWVGISLAPMLSLDGTWQSFAESLSRNAPYVISTVLWVYWGVCISDMVPFYLGKLFRRSGASDDVCLKLGIDKEKALSITRAVQRYGNLIGFVERFSVGVRNPTSFLAGALLAHCFDQQHLRLSFVLLALSAARHLTYQLYLMPHVKVSRLCFHKLWLLPQHCSFSYAAIAPTSPAQSELINSRVPEIVEYGKMNALKAMSQLSGKLEAFRFAESLQMDRILNG
ncbi:hypothetical protein HHK36_013048 [Tetracentron sinense]|uniref:Uncharacterized protein n=1 Tax=Tetracentron sinense TaxID=13715 RepID=A0A834ZDY9_TETSI|nr:hypothetical protein HHK36_013048 [Tetracentron sinense]